MLSLMAVQALVLVVSKVMVADMSRGGHRFGHHLRYMVSNWCQ